MRILSDNYENNSAELLAFTFFFLSPFPKDKRLRNPAPKLDLALQRFISGATYLINQLTFIIINYIN